MFTLYSICCFRLCLDEMLDILEAEDDIINFTIYTCPPNIHMLSDVDNNKEDAVVKDLNHLSKHECVRKSDRGLHLEIIGQDDSSDGNLPLSHTAFNTIAKK